MQIIITDNSEQLEAKLDTILERISHMATQDDINVLVAQLETLGVNLNTALTGIQADIDAIIAANPAVDLSALQASVTALATSVATATALDESYPPA